MIDNFVIYIIINKIAPRKVQYLQLPCKHEVTLISPKLSAMLLIINWLS